MAISTPLYGLVLAGGQSKRMQRDKSTIQYHGVSQARHCYALLEQCCTKTFLSNRSDQAKLAEHNGLEQIHDVYDQIGPLGGILSAMQEYPKVAWLVLACDLPFVEEKTLNHLIQSRNPLLMATAYLGAGQDPLPEPLCAIYEPAFLTGLLEFYRQGIVCPRKILRQSDAKLIRQIDSHSLDNVNNEEELRQAQKYIKTEASTNA